MNVAGIWWLEGRDLREIERFDLGPAIVIVPGEELLLLAADLPLKGQRRRVEALPFALEDRIAAPLHAVHIALGAELTPQRHLAGVVSHDVMRGWITALVAAGLGHARIVPASLALPVPAEGGWSVDLVDDRALIRSSDGLGFTLPAERLVTVWTIAGRPDCVAYGRPLPVEMRGDDAHLQPAPLAVRLAEPALDLRQGVYALPSNGMPKLARRVAMVAGFGLIAHGALAALDTLAIDHIAAKRATETRALLAQIAPSVIVGDDLAATAADLLPETTSAPSPFLAPLVRIGGALKQLGPTFALRSIGFDAKAGTLMLQLEAADMAGLQRVTGALSAQGLSAESGAASMNQGKAVGAFLVRSKS